MGDAIATKANNDILNRIHQMTAKKILEFLQSDECTPQELAQAIKFLKDNNVIADLDHSPALQAIANEVVAPKELPFAVEDADEEDDDVD